MSFWTSANGRIFGTFKEDIGKKEAIRYLESIIGKQLLSKYGEATEQEWYYAFDHEDEYMPLGSEGSLHASYYYTRKTGKYEIYISGHLRDVESCDGVIQWFMKAVKTLNCRRAEIIASVDGMDEEQKWVWDKGYANTEIPKKKEVV